LTDLTPIIIGFPIENELRKDVNFLNKSSIIKEGIDFEKVIPHITLWMGFVSVEDLEYVYNDFYKVFSSISLELSLRDQQIYEGVNGSVLSLGVLNCQDLSIIQNRIHHFWEPYRRSCKGYENFNDGTLLYVNDFKKHSLEGYDPHITVGFADEKGDFELINFKIDNPQIFLMGNNWTCLQGINV
jgi:hypothetical protein